jgi:hypothetical protein
MRISRATDAVTHLPEDRTSAAGDRGHDRVAEPANRRDQRQPAGGDQKAAEGLPATEATAINMLSWARVTLGGGRRRRYCDGCLRLLNGRLRYLRRRRLRRPLTGARRPR